MAEKRPGRGSAPSLLRVDRRPCGSWAERAARLRRRRSRLYLRRRDLGLWRADVKLAGKLSRWFRFLCRRSCYAPDRGWPHGQGERKEQSQMTNEKVIMLIEAKIQPQR